MYKYTLKSGNVSIKPPKVDSLSEIKITTEQTSDCVKIHEEFPNGLIFDMIQYSDRIEYITNKKIIVLEDFTLAFED